MQDVRFIKIKKIYDSYDSRYDEVDIFSTETDPILQIKINGEWCNVRVEEITEFKSENARKIYERKIAERH